MAVQSIVQVNQGLDLEMRPGVLFLQILLLILGHLRLVLGLQPVLVLQVESEHFRVAIYKFLELVLIIEIKDSLRKRELPVVPHLVGHDRLQVLEVLKVLLLDLVGVGDEHVRMDVQIIQSDDALSIEREVRLSQNAIFLALRQKFRQLLIKAGFVLLDLVSVHCDVLVELLVLELLVLGVHVDELPLRLRGETR